MIVHPSPPIFRFLLKSVLLMPQLYRSSAFDRLCASNRTERCRTSLRSERWLTQRGGCPINHHKLPNHDNAGTLLQCVTGTQFRVPVF